MSMTMETLLERATDASLRKDDLELVKKFCDAVRSERNGGQDAPYMILDKVRSPKLSVALRALTLLEAVVKNTGPDTHSVIGKFRFLNELIKMVSPKYYSDTPIEVKARVLDLIQKWNFCLPDQQKVREVYAMLKKQGVKFPINEHEEASDIPIGPGFLEVSSRAFGDRVSPLEEADAKKAKLLQKLLKSKDPNDLMRANKLIKKMAQLDAKKSEKAVKLQNDIEVVTNNTKLLTDMLTHFTIGVDGRLEDNEVIQDLYKSCSEMRPKLFKLASEFNDKDDGLGYVLAANDDLTRVLDLYNNLQAQQTGNTASKQQSRPAAAAASSAASNPWQQQQPAQQQQQQSQAASGSDDLLSSLIDLDNTPSQTNSAPSLEQQFGGIDLSSGGGGSSASKPNNDNLLDDLMLGGPMMTTSQPAMQQSNASGGGGSSNGMGQDLLGGLLSAAPAQPQIQQPPPSLAELEFSLDSIQPGNFPPVNAYDKNGLRVILHFAKNSPHPAIHVAVVAFLNLQGNPVTNIQFQAAVPKVMQVKLQSPSGTELPSHNPVQAPATITQVMVLSNPTNAQIRLKFRLSFTINGQNIVEMGETAAFPWN